MEGKGISQALMDPSAYDEEVTEEISMIQTHISWIFLTGQYAYKIKKPVDFGFLDFTTVENRKKYCDIELELNKVLCPDVYLDVLPVTDDGGRIAINGSGKTIDYALKMRQLPQERLMNRLLDKGVIGKGVIDKIARMIADFHRRAETSDEISQYGKPENILSNWRDNFSKTRHFAGRVISMADFDYATNRIIDFIRKNAETFEKRVAEGKVRRIHGDMHSGNIFIVDGKPFIFDRIEFNMRFSCMDTAADVAFCSMDLDFKKRLELSGFFVDRYMKYSGDEDIVKVLDFYKCYYAWVRGEVNALRLKENLKVEERGVIAQESRKYFILAIDYAKRMK
jgi:aminoglycoside phosphotransferase family enzyme